MNNHLYSVSQQESIRSGLSEYEANWAGQYFIGASAYWKVVDSVLLVGSVPYTNLGAELRSSPVVGSGAGTTTAIALTYTF